MMAENQKQGNPEKSQTTNRERRVWQSMWSMVAAAALIAAVVIVVALLKARAEGDTYSFLNGMSLGLLATLPVGMGYLLFRASARWTSSGSASRSGPRLRLFADDGRSDGGVRGDKLYQYGLSAVGSVCVRDGCLYGGGGARRGTGEGRAGVTQGQVTRATESGATSGWK